MEVSSGQMGRTNSLWSLSYRRLADFDVPNFRSNGVSGQILAVVTCFDLLLVPHVAHNFIEHCLEKITGEFVGCSSFLLDRYGQLEDFVVYELTAEENYCPNFELLDSVLRNSFNEVKYVHPRIPAD